MATPDPRRYRIFAIRLRRGALAIGRLDPEDILTSGPHALRVRP